MPPIFHGFDVFFDEACKLQSSTQVGDEHRHTTGLEYSQKHLGGALTNCEELGFDNPGCGVEGEAEYTIDAANQFREDKRRHHAVHHPYEPGAKDDAPDCTTLALLTAAGVSLGGSLFAQLLSDQCFPCNRYLPSVNE